MDRTLKGLIAVFFGVLTGGLIALSLWKPLWWLGMILGGGVGYLYYECAVVKKVAIEVAVDLLEEFSEDFPHISIWCRCAFYRTLSLSSVFLALVAPNFLVFVGPNYAVTLKYPGDFSLSIFGLTMTILFPLPNRVTDEIPCYLSTSDKIRRWKHSLIYTNPLAIAFYWPCYVYFHILLYACVAFDMFISGVCLIARKSVTNFWPIATLLIRFTKTVIITIYSEERLLVAFSAFNGVAVLYFADSFLWGLAFGGVMWLVSYELLSKRVLHLIPLRR